MDDGLLRYFPAYQLEASWQMAPGIKVVRTPGANIPLHIQTEDFHANLIASMPQVSEMDRAISLMQAKGLGDFQREGPVIIKPARTTCDAMMDTMLNFSSTDYRQPFRIIGVELPPSITGQHYPCLTMVWKMSEDSIFVWTYSRVTEYTYHCSIGSDYPTIEDRLGKAEGVESEEEYLLMIVGSRIALNLCMMSTFKPFDVTPLPRKVALHRRRGDDRLNRLAGRVYQEVVFRDLVVAQRPADPDRYVASGRHQRQHRRRCHWKRQPYGERSSLRKWKWIDEYYAGQGGAGEAPQTIILE